jgi:quercetin dioxygenase-like cupin family protein
MKMDVHHLTFAEKFINPVLDNGVSKVVQFSFEKGKVLEKHKTSSDILVTVLSGQVRFKADEEVLLQAGDLLSLDRDVEHSIEAVEESVVVLTLTPSPSTHTIFKPIADPGKFVLTKRNGPL